MINRREFIRTLSLAPLGVGVDFADAAVSEKKRIIREAIEQIMSEAPRGAYLPGPTRLLSLPNTSDTTSFRIEDWIAAESVTQSFARARCYFKDTYPLSAFEKKKREYEKRHPGYQIIPYMIVPKDAMISQGIEEKPTIIHLARKKHPKPTSADTYLREWMGPLESGFLVDIIGVAGKAETYEGLCRVKSLGAGTNFDIHDTEGRQYIILATAYPQYGDKEPNIQTPFSEGLAHPKILAQGKVYFETLQGSIARQLEEAEWGNILRELDWYKIIQGLILTENMSVALKGMSEREEKQFYDRELRKVFALLGANLSEAFQRKSSAGAKGLVQFTEGAWEGKLDEQGKKTGIRYHYPLPGFEKNPDFSTIIKNHELSIMAACAHVARQYHDYLKHPKVADAFRSLELPFKHIVLAAGYNSNNSKRIGDFFRAFHLSREGLVGITDRFYGILTHSGAEETRGYMRKFVYALRSLGYFVPEVSFSRLSAYSLPE